MTPDCIKTFSALEAATKEGGDFTYLHFKAISRRTGLPRRRVRLACRRLKRMGLAVFRTGLWTEDGEPYGSGYAVVARWRRRE